MAALTAFTLAPNTGEAVRGTLASSSVLLPIIQEPYPKSRRLGLLTDEATYAIITLNYRFITIYHYEITDRFGEQGSHLRSG
jgi:hypothetical protein